jgi:hypothetical protein
MTVEDVYEAITEHLAYLDGQAADCERSARCGSLVNELRMESAASVFAEVAAELRNTLGLEQP